MVDLFAKLASFLSSLTDIRFVSYDVNILGHSKLFESKYIPSLHLQAANNRKPELLRYKGDRTLELMTLFLKQAGSDPKL